MFQQFGRDMDFWKTESENGQTNSVLSGMQEFVDSPAVSNNSVEYSSDSVESPVERPKLKLPSKSIQLAKKRLQAYCINSLKAKEAREEKPDNTGNEKAPKPSYSKTQKTVYPDDVAKAVIRDIELLKKTGFGYSSGGTVSNVSIPEDSVVSLAQVHSDSPSVSVKSGKVGTFIKREIKCRNIRKSEPYRRRSISPKTQHEATDSGSKEYPKNWTEYKKLELNVEKDSLLKSKLFKKSKDRKFTFKTYFNFDAPSVPIESFKVKFKSGLTSSVPFSSLRCTAAKPQILYSATQHKAQPTYLSRDQLFGQIPRERMLIIEKLGKPSRCQPFENALAARKWYPKTWKKIDSSEVKLLEKSVGLSFLQSYSDEEEDVSEDNKPVNVEERDVKIANLDNNSSIPSKPEALVENQEELGKIIKAKKSKWDDIIETVDPDVSSYDGTPPIEDKEEGEVLSEEEGKCNNAGEYEKTKEELEKLEATLKTSTDLSLEDSNIQKTPEQNSERKKSKKKRKHSDKNDTVKNNHSKKRSYMKSSSKSFESEDETSNRRDKKKKKKYSKPKHEKAKSRRIKKKKRMSKADHDRSESEDIDVQLELEDSLLKKMRKKKKKLMQTIDHNRSQSKDLDERLELKDNLHKKKRKRKAKEKSESSFEPSYKASNVKDSDNSEQENYEDDIQFFAARFDAETKLKGKSRNKTATIITLEDLSIPHSKLDEKVLKRKSIESEDLILPDAITKKSEEIEKEDTVEIKVDLLKMNEDYLREQKKKEEEKVLCTPPNESGIDSDRKMALNTDSCLLKEVQCEKEESEKPAEDATEPENNLQTLGTANESQLFDVSNSVVVDSTAKNTISEPDWDILKNKRKIFKSNDEEATLNENALKNTVNDSCGSSDELLSSAMTMPILDIVKKEKEDIQIPNTNSWEKIIDFQSTKSRSLNLEMPLNIKPFLRREVKIEKDFWDIEEAPTRRSYDNKKKAHKKIESHQPEHIEKTPDELILTPKKHSDKTRRDPFSTQVKLEADNIIDVDLNNSNTCITLENEYEEFMKALSTSTEKPNVNESVMIDCSPTKQAKPQRCIDADSFLIDEPANVATNLEQLKSIPVPDVTPVQIPLPPIQPVPAPSPNIEAIIDINKSLCLSVSASVTQNITLSLATSVPSTSAPVTSTIDISKPTFHISTPFSKDNVPIDLNTTVEHNNVVTTSVDSVNAMTDPKLQACTSTEEGKCEKLIFTSLTLPSKKLLLGNSKLNLGDSDSEDLNVVEEMKRKKLESLIEDNKKEVLSQQLGKSPVKYFEAELAHSSAAVKEDNLRKSSKGNISPKRYKRDLSPSIRRNRNSPGRRRESSPRRRTFSPRRKSPKRRSPIRKRKSPGRRSLSPKKRRKSPSPRRRRSPLPKNRLSPRRHGNAAPKTKRVSVSRENRSVKRSPLRYRESSPLKRSIADSTISDEQLQQVNDHCHSGKESKTDNYSPRRLSLDDRINEVLGLQPVEHTSQNLPGCDASFYDKTIDQYQFDCQNEPFEHQYSNIQSQVSAVTRRTGTYRNPQSTYKQVGNMLQIVPTENLTDIHMPYNTDSHSRSEMADYPSGPKQTQPTQQTTPFMMKSKYLQVGNMLQIVPTEMVPSELMVDSGVQNEIKTELSEDNRRLDNVGTEKSSAETSMLLKVAERRAEKENRRQERERRKKEKERRKKAKEKVRQAKLKIKTENMIRKALELEGQDEENMEFELASKLVQWPPIPNISAYCLSKEAGKSILLNNKTRHLKSKKVKLVQFADGVRPGEGTSPSGGEELSSPPPPEKQLLKEKRFKKLKFGKTCVKKKVKVKVIKKLPSPLDESDSDDTLPPPSPPPGSPPPHIFPPRIKVNAVNNVPPPFLASIMHPGQHQQQQQQTPQQTQYQPNMYRPPLNMLLTHPPSIQGHLPSHGPVIAAGLSPQGHYHPGLSVPPPQSHSTGHNHRHY